VDFPVATAELVRLGLAELRALRRRAGQAEADLSYLRRLVQGRLDILRAEQARRSPAPRPSPAAASGVPQQPREHPRHPAGGGPEGSARTDPAHGELLADLPRILADLPSRVRTSARHVTLGTPVDPFCSALADELMGDSGLADLSDLATRSDAALADACARLEEHELRLSAERQRLQALADACGAEITRRYREGEAHVEDLLTEG